MIFLQIVLLSLAVQQTTFYLVEGKIFSWLRKKLPLDGLWTCPACTGFWVSLALVRKPDTIEVLSVAALAHIIYLLREKFLPCSACTPKQEEFKIV